MLSTTDDILRSKSEWISAASKVCNTACSRATEQKSSLDAINCTQMHVFLCSCTYTTSVAIVQGPFLPILPEDWMCR